MTRSRERVEPPSRSQWGRWLAEHHASSPGVWLRIDARNAPGDDALSYDNTVRELLCWGWVDGQARRDGEASLVWCCPRRPGSGWAATNKARVAELTEQGRMQGPGLVAVEVARANGSWTVLDGPEAGLEPEELTTALDAVPRARRFWDELPPSARKHALSQIAFAKREATRRSRIEAVVRRCAAHERPDR
ncbi:YdeI/OmpD-associated family protein [Aeromicrobium halocynthiae]|uniref:YdeI/OmpD-associated family protein n=1 Tax=Aeromicrobium halocynthiae TaxID=560557 RepID=A0ABP5H9P0_9ACTN